MTNGAQETLKSQVSKRLYSGIGAIVAEAGNRFFTDSQDGRSLMLRGVNLSGSVKQPFEPYLPSHEIKNFFQGDKVSFVGRPFPLAEADSHFARLSSWGFNFLRFNITWEALEHEGPGIYDRDYIDYVVAILLKAKQYGFRVFIDPHQDVWSRFTGGSGAPLWTLDAVGFDPQNFSATFSAIVQNTFVDPTRFPKMIWPTNYWKLATSTMFTLFFAGKVFAPNCLVEGVNIQDWLQNHYCNAVCELAKAIYKAPGLADSVVVGYDTLNEPSMGLIGLEDIRELAKEQELRKGLTPSPFQAMLLGMGLSTENVQEWDMTAVGPQKMADRLLDPKGVSAWKQGKKCIWADHGVWDPSTKTCLKPSYFHTNPTTGIPVNGLVDFWKPFVNRYTSCIRKVHPRAIIFVEPPVNAYPPIFGEEGDLEGPLVFAPHWYDGLTLINKHWSSWYNVDYIGFIRGMYSSIAFAVKFGEAAIKKAFQSQLRMLRLEGEESLGGYPTVFGEIGIPFDLDGKSAYMTGGYTSQISALDANMTALERDLLSFTLWNYTSDNCHKWGDQWNGEDLSLWSPPETMTTDPLDLNEGARALEAFVRPFPIATPGTPKQLSFDLKQGIFTYAFVHSTREDGRWDAFGSCGLSSTTCEIFLPKLHFPAIEEIEVWVSGGTYAILPDHQRLIWQCGCTTIERDKESPSSDESSDISQTSDVPLTKGKVADCTVAHKIVVQRRRKEEGEKRDGAEIAKMMDSDESEAVCPSACCVM